MSKKVQHEIRQPIVEALLGRATVLGLLDVMPHAAQPAGDAGSCRGIVVDDQYSGQVRANK